MESVESNSDPNSSETYFAWDGSDYSEFSSNSDDGDIEEFMSADEKNDFEQAKIFDLTYSYEDKDLFTAENMEAMKVKKKFDWKVKNRVLSL